MKNTPPALLLDRATVASLLTLDGCIDAVETAFAAHARGETLATERLHVDGLAGEFHVKAGGLKTPRACFTCKVNGGFFQNRTRRGFRRKNARRPWAGRAGHNGSGRSDVRQ